MEIDFRNVEVKDIEGNPVTVDLSKELGNMMYLNAQDIADADLGHDIYHKGKVELNKEQASIVKGYIDKGFKAIVKRVMMPVLDSVQ